MGFFTLGLNLGMIYSFLFHNAILYMIKSDPPELTLFLEIVFIGNFMTLGTIAGMLSCCLWRKVVIMSSSILGSYLFFRGISLMIGGYPLEFTVNKQILFYQMD